MKKQPKVIAVDVDGTLCREVCWTSEDVLGATPIKKMVEIVNLLYRSHFIVVFTARQDELILPTLKWLRRNGIMFNAISNNKMGSDLYIDDKAINPKSLNKNNIKKFIR